MGDIISCFFGRRSSAGSRCLVLALALVSAACGDAPSPQPTASQPPPPELSRDGPADATIIVLGDSLAAGLGLPEAEAFPALVEAELQDRGHAIRVVNAGVSGDTSAGGLARLDWILAQEPDVLVVELGANDALRGQPLENTEKNLREIVRRGLAGGARVLLLGMDVPTNYGPDYASRFSALYGEISELEGVPLVPGFIREVGLDAELMQSDGLHPTAAGQRRLAEALVPYLENIITELNQEPIRPDSPNTMPS